jgi:hypothetical protein
MWILKSSKDLLEYIESRSLSSYNNIKTFVFSSVYATFHHSKLIDRLKPSVHLWFIKQNAQRRYKCIVLGRDTSYFVKVTAPILPKSSLKLISSKCCYFHFITILTLSNFADFSIESIRSSKLSVSVSLSLFLFLFLFSSLEVPLSLVPLVLGACGKFKVI